MKRLFLFTLFIVVLMPMASCQKAAPVPQEKSEPVGGSSAMKVDLLSLKEPVPTTESFRRAFNETANEMFDLQWVTDRIRPGQIDIVEGELAVPDAQRDSYGIFEEGPIMETSGIKRALKLIGDRLEERRNYALKKALDEEIEYHSTFDLAILTKPNRKAARILMEVGYLIGDLYKLQNHPNCLDFERQLIHSGDPVSLMFFKRMSSPASLKYGDPVYANALPTFPDRMVGAIMWPAGMNNDLLMELKKSAGENPKDPFLSPFTVVKRAADRKLVWLPNAVYPPFADTIRKISKRLAEAASVEGIAPTFARQLALQSEAIASRLPYPFYKSDEAWVKTKGQMELIVGPYEPDRDSYDTKAFYEYLLAAENPKATRFLARLKTMLPEIELGIAGTVTGDIYKARDIDVDPRLRVVDVILATGVNTGDEGPYLATILPNMGPYSSEERRKTVIMATHHEAKLPILKAIADATLTPIMADSVDAGAFIMFSTLRSLMHDLGPQPDMEVRDGKTARELLGADFNRIKQAKAGVAAAWAAHLLASKGIINNEELKQVYATYLANLFRYIRFGMSSPHGAGAAAEFSYLISNGAIRQTGSRLEIDTSNIHTVLSSYLGDLVRAMATANKDGATELLAGYTLKSADRIADVMNSMKRANIPRDVAVYYHVEGL